MSDETKFPKHRDFFHLELHGDQSWRGDLWVCVASDDETVVAVNLTGSTYGDAPHTIGRDRADFVPAKKMLAYKILKNAK